MKRFAVFLKSEDASQVAALAEEFKGKQQGYWHWTPNSWLILDPSNILTAVSLRDLIGKTHPNVHVVVIEIPPGATWAGFGPSSGENDMFKWFKTEWMK